MRRLRLATVQRHRLDAKKARTDMRDWAKARREHARHLIEPGGLVHKAGLVELTDDDRATSPHDGAVVASAPSRQNARPLPPSGKLRTDRKRE